MNFYAITLNNNLCLLIILCCTLTFYSCCDQEVFSYELEVNYSLNQNTLALGTSFELNVTIPDELQTIDGELMDISDPDFKFRLSIFRYNNDENLDYWQFERAEELFEVDSASFEDEINLLALPVQTENGRFISFTLSPGLRDIFVISISSLGGNEGTGSCAPVHELVFVNNDLPLEESNLNILPEASGFDMGQRTAGLVIVQVV